jgi:cell fate (sporulation/competence/biofilm development) regulator YmcA (YheA/YmcA/DUF963 family)
MTDTNQIPLEEHADEGDRTFRKMLRVKLTHEERLAKGSALVHAMAEIDALADELSEIKKSHGARKKKVEERIDKLRTDVEHGSEERSVVCEEVRDFQRNIVLIRRTDTGEAIEERAMEVDERQLELDAAPPEAPDGPPAEPGEVKTSSADVKERKAKRKRKEEEGAPAGA